MEQIINYLAEKNGFDQDIFVLEEMSELQKELTKRLRGKNNINDIIEEGADVLLTSLILLRAYGYLEKEVKPLLLMQDNHETEFSVFRLMAELQRELMIHRSGYKNDDMVVVKCINLMASVTSFLQKCGAAEKEVRSCMESKLNRLRDFLPEREPR